LHAYEKYFQKDFNVKTRYRKRPVFTMPYQKFAGEEFDTRIAYNKFQVSK